MHDDDAKVLYWLGEYDTMQELWQRCLYFVEIFYLVDSYYAVVIICFQNYEIGAHTHPGYWIVCDGHLFNIENLFYSPFKRSDRRKAVMCSYSHFGTTIKSHNNSMPSDKVPAAREV